MIKPISVLCSLTLLALATPAAAVNTTYSCGGAGVTFVVEVEPETGTARMTGPAGYREMSATADGAWRSADGERRFFPDREPPQLFLGEADFPCETLQGELQGFPGQSLGGRLRAGPGMDHDPVGSLADGAPLTILEAAGVAMEGYEWFRIRLPDGRNAYQWGGIMCSVDQLIGGVFEICGQSDGGQ